MQQYLVILRLCTIKFICNEGRRYSLQLAESLNEL